MKSDKSSRVRVLLIHQAFASKGEAGGTRHFELGRQLVSSGHCFTVVASQVGYLTGQRHATAAEREEVVDGVRVLRAWAPSVLHRSFVWRVLAFVAFMTSAIWPALRCGQVDLVMGTSPPMFQALTAWFVAVLRRRPFLLEIRDLWPEFAIDMGVLKNRTLIWVSRRLEAFLYRRATHLLVNSPAYRDYLLSRGVPAQKITFIANGVDPEMFSDTHGAAQLRTELKLEGKFVATYAGALGMANDIETILRAAVELASDQSIHILIVGDGKERSALEVRARELGLTNVTFAGARPKSDMPAILAATDVCLATLRDIPMFRTTYPNKVFDYMAAGRATVLAIDGVIREVVEASNGGLFVPPGNPRALADAIRGLKSQPELCRRMGMAAREYVSRHFNRKHQAREFEALVRSLVPSEQSLQTIQHRRAA